MPPPIKNILKVLSKLAKFTPHTENEIKEMLSFTGKKNINDFFAEIPEDIRVKSFNLPEGITEQQAIKKMNELAALNNSEKLCFAGGGYYDHFVPSAIDAITSRTEFLTAYTPYQPEASQGTLRAIFEYQSIIKNLTGMEASNASLYDGGTALYEAVNMVFRSTGKNNVIIDGGINPLHFQMLKTHTKNLGLNFIVIPLEGIKPNLNALMQAAKKENVCAVIAQNPNFYGNVSDYSAVFAEASANNTASILSFYPLSLGLLKTPGEMGADIAVADGQSLGLPLSFGGPYLGIMAANKKYLRKMPGRIVGETVDREGRKTFVLTLQAREQHIKREKATSNICSNQALCALRAVIYLSLAGKEGLREVAAINFENSLYLREKLASIKGISVIEGDYFNEFTVKLPCKAKDFTERMSEKGFLAGIPAVSYDLNAGENLLITAVTESRTKNEMDAYAAAAAECI